MLRIEATGLTIEPSNPDAIVTIATATVSSPSMAGLGTGTITNFVLKQNGFTLGSLVLEPSPGKPVLFGNYLQLEGVKLTVTNLALVNGTLSGTVDLSLTNLELFPQATMFTTQVTGLTAHFDLADPGTQLRITIATFRLDIGEAVSLQAANVVVTPGQPVLATIASLTVGSPTIAGVAPVQLTNFVLRTDGFSFSNLTLSLIHI